MATSESLPWKLRQARLERSIKQVELARQLGVSQAAVSQFERGNTSALSFAKIKDAARVLGLDLLREREAAVESRALMYCERADCLANVAYTRGGKTIVRPRMTLAAAGMASYCCECGELLLDHCPNEDCAQPVSEGSFCAACGTAYVPPAAAGGGENGQADGRGRDLERIRELTRPRVLD
ncbi:MAG: helix-turn-helix domain-containing protein [Planctomycetes bacterium]|nr:helix-turn-helix domain-containing protein [Planctomycetota bacterium]